MSFAFQIESPFILLRPDSGYTRACNLITNSTRSQAEVVRDVECDSNHHGEK